MELRMLINFIAELKWRGMLHDVMPETEEHLLSEMRAAYMGIDPTADSLHIGHLVGVMLLKHFQIAGHKPYALIGGATGMIGDPSGKSNERNLLDEATLRHNQAALKEQLSRFLDFDSQAPNAAVLVNNYDWMKDFSFLSFIRDVGKHITVNYMMSKDSVKKRLSSEAAEGMSFTEFTYQLVKGFALTCPLITKADGTKFGKTEGGNIWLDANRTSPYAFFQYWLNTSDVDAEKYIKIFTLLDQETIAKLVIDHQDAPHLRLLQKNLAKEITTAVHGHEAYENAVKASDILFGKTTAEAVKALDTQTFLEVFEGVAQAILPISNLENGLDMIAALSAETGFLKSNGDAIRELKQNAISVNKEKVGETYLIRQKDLIDHKYVLLQRGKKNYFILVFE